MTNKNEQSEVMVIDELEIKGLIFHLFLASQKFKIDNIIETHSAMLK